MRSIALFAVFICVACAPEERQELELEAGPGSAEPHLAVGADGTVLLSYLEPMQDGTALRYSHPIKNQWSEPKTAATGEDWMVNWADFPSVMPLSNKTWAAHWLVKSDGPAYAYDAVVALSNDRGESWSDPLLLHTDGTLSEHGFVSLYPDSNGVGAVWLDGRDIAHGGPDEMEFVGTQLRTAVVQGDQRLSEGVIDPVVCDCCQTDLAIARSGPVAVYRNRTSGEIRDIYVAREVDGQWQPGKVVSHDGWEITGCPVNGPAIDARDDGVVVAWFTAHPGNRVQVAFSGDSAQAFGDAIDVGAANPIGRVDVALLKDGDAVVSWLEKGVGELLIRRVSLEHGLGEIQRVTKMATHRDAGFPQMIARAEGLVFAWTDTSDDQSRVRSLTMRVEG